MLPHFSRYPPPIHILLLHLHVLLTSISSSSVPHFIIFLIKLGWGPKECKRLWKLERKQKAFYIQNLVGGLSLWGDKLESLWKQSLQEAVLLFFYQAEAWLLLQMTRPIVAAASVKHTAYKWCSTFNWEDRQNAKKQHSKKSWLTRSSHLISCVLWLQHPLQDNAWGRAWSWNSGNSCFSKIANCPPSHDFFPPQSKKAWTFHLKKKQLVIKKIYCRDGINSFRKQNITPHLRSH